MTKKALELERAVTLAASITEPPPNATMEVAPCCWRSSTAEFMDAIGEWDPVVETKASRSPNASLILSNPAVGDLSSEDPVSSRTCPFGTELRNVGKRLKAELPNETLANEEAVYTPVEDSADIVYMVAGEVMVE